MSFPLDQQLTKNQLPKKQMATEFFFTPGKLKISFFDLPRQQKTLPCNWSFIVGF